MNFQPPVSNLPSVVTPEKYSLRESNPFHKFQTSFKLAETCIHRNLKIKTEIQSSEKKMDQTFHKSKEEKQITAFLKLKKIKVEKPFLKIRTQSQQIRAKQNIDQDIEQSLNFLRILKNKKKYDRYATENIYDNPELNYESNFVASLIGKGLKEANKPLREKRKKKFGLYSYLDRQVVQKKAQDLTKTKIFSYANHPNDKNYERLMLEKSRKFLKGASSISAKQHEKLGKVLEHESKIFIEKQLQMKRQKYGKQYKTRGNIPYFSFLSLNQEEKDSIMNRMQKKKTAS